MSQLKNSSVKQPLRTFEPMDLVMVWRKQWPAHLVAPGRRGGFQRSIRPRWIGPGRDVLFFMKFLITKRKEMREDTSCRC
jgi:hypothetical protein